MIGAVFLHLPLMVPFRFVSPDSPLFFIGMASAMFMISAFYGPVFSAIQDLTPVRLRGLMTGLLLVVSNLLGLGIGAVMIGYISDILAAMEVFEPLTKALLVIDLIDIGAPLSFMLAPVYLYRMQMPKIDSIEA